MFLYLCRSVYYIVTYISRHHYDLNFFLFIFFFLWFVYRWCYCCYLVLFSCFVVLVSFLRRELLPWRLRRVRRIPPKTQQWPHQRRIYGGPLVCPSYLWKLIWCLSSVCVCRISYTCVNTLTFIRGGGDPTTTHGQAFQRSLSLSRATPSYYYTLAVFGSERSSYTTRGEE